MNNTDKELLRKIAIDLSKACFEFALFTGIDLEYARRKMISCIGDRGEVRSAKEIPKILIEIKTGWSWVYWYWDESTTGT